MKALLLALALAQTSPRAPVPKHQPITILNLGEDEGYAANPPLSTTEVIEAPLVARHGSLIRIRENFNRQILSSIGEVK
jgi:hypothetical protein